jgi:hypothetical protein
MKPPAMRRLLIRCSGFRWGSPCGAEERLPKVPIVVGQEIQPRIAPLETAREQAALAGSDGLRYVFPVADAPSPGRLWFSGHRAGAARRKRSDAKRITIPKTIA